MTRWERERRKFTEIRDSSSQVRLTGSKLATPITAPTIAPRTTPPATMLSRKFLRDGETPEAASAASGSTMEAVNAAAVRPVIAFSLREAFTSSRLPLDFGFTATAFFDGFTCSGWKKASEVGLWSSLFWLAEVSRIAIETLAIVPNSSLLICSSGCCWEEIGAWCLDRWTKIGEKEMRGGNKRFSADVSPNCYPTWHILDPVLVDKVILVDWSCLNGPLFKCHIGPFGKRMVTNHPPLATVISHAMLLKD